MSAAGVTAAAGKRHSFSCQKAQRAAQEDPNDPAKQRDRREACT